MTLWKRCDQIIKLIDETPSEVAITQTATSTIHRVVIVGAGFAGYNAARELSRLAGFDDVSSECTLYESGCPL